MVKKQYTVSTYMFDNLKDVKDQIVEWKELKTLNPNTKVFEVIKKIDLKSECEEW